MNAGPSKRIAVARLLRPQGRRGELLAEPLSNLPGLFFPGRFFGCGSSAPGATFQKLDPVELECVWTPTGRNASRFVLKLAGVDSISAAEALAGFELSLDEADLPARDPDTFLVGDLIGCTLVDGGTSVGEIVDVEFATTPDGRTRLEDAAPFLVVQRSEPSEEEPALVPFVKAWLQEVDLEGRRVCMTLPEGLFPDAQATEHE